MDSGSPESYTVAMGKLTLSEKIDALRLVPLFSALDESELEELLRVCLVREFPAGSQVISSAEPAESFYVILSGEVKIYKTSSHGDEQILHMYGPGQTFGEAAMWANIKIPAKAETITAAAILIVRRGALKAMIEKNAEIALAMMAGLSGKLQEFNQLIAQLSLRDVPGRLAAFILQQAGDVEGDCLKLSQSKKQLAAQLGTVPETLSRALKKLKAAQWIDVQGSTITILNRSALEHISS